MRILVTGAAGFIGSNLVDKLLQTGHEIIAIDNFDPYYDRKIKEQNIAGARDYSKFHFFEMDITDEESIKNLFQKFPCEMVIHIAAKAGVRPSIEDPAGYYRANVLGTLTLLEACKEFSIKKFIFASTSSIYGNNKKVPFSENDFVDHPISPYAATKKACELLCHNYYHLYGINIFSLRFFTVYGPRQRPDLAIYKFFKLISQNQPIPLYGDGSTSRDYTYIDDILDGMLKSIQKVNGYEIINLGESQTISLVGLVELIEKILGKNADRKFMPMQPGDVDRTFADISKAKKLLGYDPQTKVEEGLMKFYEWFKQNQNI